MLVCSALSQPRVSGFMFFAWQFMADGQMKETAKVWAAMGDCVVRQVPPERCVLPALGLFSPQAT